MTLFQGPACGAILGIVIGILKMSFIVSQATGPLTSPVSESKPESHATPQTNLRSIQASQNYWV